MRVLRKMRLQPISGRPLEIRRKLIYVLLDSNKSTNTVGNFCSSRLPHEGFIMYSLRPKKSIVLGLSTQTNIDGKRPVYPYSLLPHLDFSLLRFSSSSSRSGVVSLHLATSRPTSASRRAAACLHEGPAWPSSVVEQRIKGMAPRGVRIGDGVLSRGILFRP